MSDSKSGSKTDLNESNMPLLDDVSTYYNYILYYHQGIRPYSQHFQALSGEIMKLQIFLRTSDVIIFLKLIPHCQNLNSKIGLRIKNLSDILNWSFTLLFINVRKKISKN